MTLRGFRDVVAAGVGCCLNMPQCLRSILLLISLQQSNDRRSVFLPVRCSVDLEHVCLVAQSCPTLCDPMNSSPAGSSVHGILQARILELVAISFSLCSIQIKH